MIICHILTPYTGAGAIPDEHRPLLADAYALDAWQDITGTPTTTIIPPINLLVVRAICTPETLAAIEADSRFSVLWQEVAP